jgi:hypothetical protein
VDGYAMAFVTEQMITTALGAGAVSKVGAATKTALAATRAGRVVLAGVAAVSKFNTRAVGIVINLAKNNPLSEQVVKAAKAMVDRVAGLPTRINGKSVGEIVSATVDRLDSYYDEFLRVGKPIDDFGVRAHEQLAKLLERDLGFFPGEKALRGNVRLYEKLVVEGADRYEDVLLFFKRPDGTIAKEELKASLEALHDATRNVNDLAHKYPIFQVRGVDGIQPEAYRVFNSAAIASEGSSETVLSYVKRTRRLPPRESPPTNPSARPSGHYLGFEKAATPDATRSLYQIRQSFRNDAKLRVTVSTSSVKDDCFIPYSANRDLQLPISYQLEPVCRDISVDFDTGLPLSGGGRQLATYAEAEVILIELWDDSVSSWIVQPFF